jgi:hypothetical protein
LLSFTLWKGVEAGRGFAEGLRQSLGDGKHEDVERLGAGSGSEGVEPFPKLPL